jgi:hypothetical protein
MELREDQRAPRGSAPATPTRRSAGAVARGPEYTLCDACGEGMQPMGHCKWLCRSCGFLRTCIDTV